MAWLWQYLIRYHLWAVRRHGRKLTTEQLLELEGFEVNPSEVPDHTPS